MGCALYGKLPAKRDFVAIGVSRAFLATWEPWLQGGLSASRNVLGDAWQEIFLRAPIWRFWLGAEVCGGATVCGAFMPSVDGVGRYFPLTVLASVAPPLAIPPPELDPQDAWYAAAEELLLNALDPASAFEDVGGALARLPTPRDHGSGTPPAGMVRLPDGSVLAASSSGNLPTKLAAIRVEDYGRAYATTSVWWTIGGEDFPPLTLVGHRMPDPYVFTLFLTGRAEDISA